MDHREEVEEEQCPIFGLLISIWKKHGLTLLVQAGFHSENSVAFDSNLEANPNLS